MIQMRVALESRYSLRASTSSWLLILAILVREYGTADAKILRLSQGNCRGIVAHANATRLIDQIGD
jgi:hypothetical protein